MGNIFSKPIKDDGRHTADPLVYQGRFTDKKLLGKGAVVVSVSGSGNSFGPPLQSCRLSTRRIWPLLRDRGVAGLATHKVASYPAEKAVCLDLETFVELFKDVRGFEENLMYECDCLVDMWNMKYAGNQCIGKRQALERSFVIKDISFQYTVQSVRTQAVFVLSTFVATQTLQHSSVAKLRTEDVRVSIKLRTNMFTTMPHHSGPPPVLYHDPPGSSEGNAADDLEGWEGALHYTNWGIYVSPQVFLAFMKSAEMRKAVKLAEQYLSNLEPPKHPPRYTVLGTQESPPKKRPLENSSESEEEGQSSPSNKKKRTSTRSSKRRMTPGGGDSGDDGEAPPPKRGKKNQQQKS
jgi:hypothetical protein